MGRANSVLSQVKAVVVTDVSLALVKVDLADVVAVPLARGFNPFF